MGNQRCFYWHRCKCISLAFTNKTYDIAITDTGRIYWILDTKFVHKAIMHFNVSIFLLSLGFFFTFLDRLSFVNTNGIISLTMSRR